MESFPLIYYTDKQGDQTTIFPIPSEEPNTVPNNKLVESQRTVGKQKYTAKDNIRNCSLDKIQKKDEYLAQIKMLLCLR